MVHRGSENKTLQCHWTAAYLLYVCRAGFPQHPDYVIAYYAGWPLSWTLGAKLMHFKINWKLQEMTGEWRDVWKSGGHPDAVISAPSVPVCGRHRIVDVCIVDIEASTYVHYCGVWSSTAVVFTDAPLLHNLCEFLSIAEFCNARVSVRDVVYCAVKIVLITTISLFVTHPLPSNITIFLTSGF